MTRLVVIVLCVLASSALAADDAPQAKKEDASPKKPSTLAPTIGYLEAHTFFHTGDMPKVLLLPSSSSTSSDGDDAEGAAGAADAADEPPSWLTSAAMAFKEGRVKKASAAIAPLGDLSKFAQRFAIDQESLPALMGVAGGKVWRLEARLARGGSAALKASKDFINDLVAGNLADEDAAALPSFPEPTRPRKKADAMLEEFTHESLPLNCYNSASRPLCIVALYNQQAGTGCPKPMAKLSRAFRNDKTIGFGCIGAAKQTEFLGSLGISSADELPALLAVKGGRRPRAARMQGGSLDDPLGTMSSFVDSVIGGGASFTKLADGLPDLEPPYLLEKDEV